MKKIIFLGGMVIIGAILVLNASNTSEVINQITATSTVEVRVDVLEERIKNEQKARHNEIEEKVETYRQTLLDEVADDVKKEYILEIESTITDESY